MQEFTPHYLYDLLMQAPAAIAVVRGPQHVYELVNPLMSQVLGQRELVGKPIREAIPELAGQGWFEILDQVYASGKTHQGTERRAMLDRHNNGQLEETYFDYTIQPTYNAQGEVDGIITFGVEVTEQVRARQEVQAAHAEAEAARKRLYELFMLAPVPICVVRGSTHVFELANPLRRQMAGNRELVGKPIREAQPELAGQGWFEILDQVYASGKPYYVNEGTAMLDRHNNGQLEEARFNYTFQPTRNAQGEVEGILALGVEVTELVRARQEAQESRQRLELAQQAGHIGTFEWDIQRQSIHWTAEMEALYGLAAGTFKQTYQAWINLISPLDLPRFEKRLQAAVADGKPWHDEFRIIWPDGSLRWLASRAVVALDAQHRSVRMIGVNIDITASKELDEQKDAFVGVASHELKTPVTSLKMYADLLQRRFERTGDDDSAHLVEKMNRQVDRLATLIQDLLDITQLEVGQLHIVPRPTDLLAVVHESVEMVQTASPAHNILIEEATSPLPLICADAKRITQVVTNLLSNAVKYTPANSQVIIRLAHTPDEVRVSVQDNGPGIARERQPHLFQRFCRMSGPLEKSYPGLGLGLYIASEIIAHHQGQIWVESEIGEGATFSFTLPVHFPKSSKG